MVRQLLNIFAVTLALVAAAVVSAVILDLQFVQAYLGIAASSVDSSAGSAWLSLKAAALAGLLVDGLRLLAARWWHQSRQRQHDLRDVFRSSLA